MKKVNQIKTKKGMKINDLTKEMSKVGVMGAGKLANAIDVTEEMLNDKDCTVFLGAAGALVPGGMRNVLIDLIKEVDVFVTTGAMLTHDLVESLGFSHIQGDEKADDAKLSKKGLVRMYDSLMPTKSYENMEDFFDKHFDELKETESIKEFLFKLGSFTDKNSILGTCYRKKIPLFCPALADSGIGLMIYNHLAKNKEIKTKAFEDLKDIMDICWESEKTGVIYLGGGVPKNYIQQAMQLAKPASYGVQITTDRPEPGGSSGAELKEGISWNKMKEKGKFVDVFCDVTIALPIIVSTLKDRL